MKTPQTAAPARAHERVDWSQLWYPGPSRVFTAEELARAGADAPSRTLAVVAGFNVALLAFALLQVAPAELTARLSALFIGLLGAGWYGALALWQQPSRRRLLRLTLAYAAVFAVLMLGVRWRMGSSPLMPWIFGPSWAVVLLVTCAWWVLAQYRAHLIEGRLREMAERDQAVALAGQLMAAQIQPHFLFNSLASLQHWVHTRDERAAPLLDALTGFLRATLPLFNRQQLALGEELVAVRRYLEVMQARLGERLRFDIDLPAALMPLALPPGLLLTLVENAVEHGVQPCLGGASVHLRGHLQGEQVIVEVVDTGAGLGTDHAAGLGLSNSRARLAQAWGKAATLELHPRDGGGCIATVTLPRRALDAEPTTP